MTGHVGGRPTLERRGRFAGGGRADGAALVAELAALAGRRIDDHEIRAVNALSQQMPAQWANDVWRRHQHAPATVSLRDYLAITMCFINQAPPN